MLYTAFGYVLIMILWNVSTMIYFTMKYIIMTLCEVLFTMITYARNELEVTLNHLHTQLQQQDNEKLIAYLVVLVVIFIIMTLYNCLQQQKINKILIVARKNKSYSNLQQQQEIKKLLQEKTNLISSLQTSVMEESYTPATAIATTRDQGFITRERTP